MADNEALGLRRQGYASQLVNKKDLSELECITTWPVAWFETLVRRLQGHVLSQLLFIVMPEVIMA